MLLVWPLIISTSYYCTVNCVALNIKSEAFKTSVVYIQAQDPQAVQNTFESFCHSVVSKGDQIVHKLLGDQFKVCWQGIKVHNLFKHDSSLYMECWGLCPFPFTPWGAQLHGNWPSSPSVLGQLFDLSSPHGVMAIKPFLWAPAI